MHDQSYYVHLESLTDFIRELEIQIEGMSKPQDFLHTLNGHPLLFGEFGEAGSLTDAHNAAVAEMQGLLDQVKGAITFAQDVTHTVADGYEQAEDKVGFANACLQLGQVELAPPAPLAPVPQQRADACFDRCR